MYTIALVAQKGGTGKTTLAINLAVMAESAGHRAVLLDLDPQASAARWGDHRRRERPAVVALPASRLESTLGVAREHGAKMVIIDTAPHSESAALAAVRSCDLALVPLRPGVLDLRALGSTADICALAQRPAVVVLNQTPPQGSLADQAAAVVASRDMCVAPHRIGARVAFVHSITAGSGVVEYEPGGKAAAEIRQVFAWVWERLSRGVSHRGES